MGRVWAWRGGGGEVLAPRSLNLGRGGHAFKGPIRRANDPASVHWPIAPKSWRIHNLRSDPSTLEAEKPAMTQTTMAKLAPVTQTSPTRVVEQILPSRMEENEEIQPPMALFLDICAQNSPIINTVKLSSQTEVHGTDA